MCQNEIVLAEHSTTRYISQCEHDTVHLMWDGLGLHLTQERFYAMADVIEKALREASALPGRRRDGIFRLRVNPIVLGIPADQFIQFWALIEQALPHVDRLAGKGDSGFGPTVGRIHSMTQIISAN
jgi:hypothetical protein